jgi:hypothetical protein
MKIYMFRTVILSIIRSLFTVHSAMVYVVQNWEQLSNRTRSCSKAVYKPVGHTPLLSVQWINSWWWTEELSEICRVSWQNKFVKLVHLVVLITKKFVTMYGHVNVIKSRRLFMMSSKARNNVRIHVWLSVGPQVRLFEVQDVTSTS